MYLPFGKIIRRSKQNGWIFVTKKGEVLVDGVKQTSQWYSLLWVDAFMHAEELLKRKVETVLMLGLAGGGALLAIEQSYPDSLVTAVEHDAEMIEIARELNKKAATAIPFPEVLLGDAKEVVKNLDRKFDVIMVDIFNGRRPSHLIDDDSFWELLAEKLEIGGVIVMNVAIDSTRVYTANKHFKNFRLWQYEANTFCALSN